MVPEQDPQGPVPARRRRIPRHGGCQPVSTSPATNIWPPCWAAASPPSAASPISPASRAACGITRACPGVGWLAVALVIFCLWKPSAAIWGSILFGCLQNLYLRLSIPFIPSQIYKILPYIVTVVVLIFSSLRNNREKQPPAALGVPYFREER